MTYYIDYQTGAGNEYVTGTLEHAKAVADDHAARTERDICIYNEADELVATRRWFGIAYDEETDVDVEDPITFGCQGFYDDWH